MPFWKKKKNVWYQRIRDGGEKIDLSEERMGAGPVKAIARALEDPKTNVKVLSLYNSFIGVEGGKAIAKALQSNSTMTTLDLSGNFIGDEGAKAIAKALELNTTLTELILWSNTIRNQGATAIAKALESNCTLVSLCLGWNCIGAEGHKAIAKALKSNSTLTTLDLSSNTIGDGGAAIAKALESNSTLVSLRLGWNNNRGDDIRNKINTLLANRKRRAQRMSTQEPTVGCYVVSCCSPKIPVLTNSVLAAALVIVFMALAILCLSKHWWSS